MIRVTKVGGEVFFLNERYIESIEATKDTMIKIHDGTTYMVEEKPEALIAMINACTRLIEESTGEVRHGQHIR